MNREIKFRAWCGGAGPMKHNVGVHPFMLFRLSAFDICDAGEYGDNTGDLVVSQGAYEIMQYTGLKDKNGVEIYEGDIIEHSDAAWRAKVEWCESGKWVLNYTAMGREVLLSDRTDYIIVIGNIHSNPELL